MFSTKVLLSVFIFAHLLSDVFDFMDSSDHFLCPITEFLHPRDELSEALRVVTGSGVRLQRRIGATKTLQHILRLGIDQQFVLAKEGAYFDQQRATRLAGTIGDIALFVVKNLQGGD